MPVPLVTIPSDSSMKVKEGGTSVKQKQRRSPRERFCSWRACAELPLLWANDGSNWDQPGSTSLQFGLSQFQVDRSGLQVAPSEPQIGPKTTPRPPQDDPKSGFKLTFSLRKTIYLGQTCDFGLQLNENVAKADLSFLIWFFH